MTLSCIRTAQIVTGRKVAISRNLETKAARVRRNNEQVKRRMSYPTWQKEKVADRDMNTQSLSHRKA